ncbi:hypothetical protein [Lacticigenium naphthae]|uniref:hypothetical protein n=1 Tax=Lacticigenium naphthae TaxID=515351 RepID=UPI000429B1C1|nr:hypothetical protein [Lacticigenium naphthae]
MVNKETHKNTEKNALFSSKFIHELPKNFEEKTVQSNYISKENSYKRNSTPFQVKKIPSPYYGYSQKPVVEKINYSALKDNLKKSSNEFILFENFMKNQLKLKKSSKQKSQTPSLIKRKGLKKTLTGIIEEDQKNQLARNKNMSSLFSDKTE